MDRYDIILQAGQSNAEGCGRGPVEQEYIPSPDILYLNAEKTVVFSPTDGATITYADAPFSITVAEERTDESGPIGDFSLTFAKRYVESGMLKDGRKLLIIRAAVGGTGFKRKNWGKGCQLTQKMHDLIAYALSLNPENRLVAFLWHQGEHEVARGTIPDEYKCAMTELVQTVRQQYNVATLPFIAGDFVPQWIATQPDSYPPIINRLRAICDEIGFAAFAESEGLLSNAQANGSADIIHFCRQSLHEFGVRYFEAFQKILAQG